MKRFIFALLLIFCASASAGQPLRTNTATEIMVTLLDSSGAPVTSLTSIGGIEIWLYTIAYNAPTITEQTEITPTASAGNNDMVHKHNGLWTLELTAGNTNFVGRMNIAIYDADNTDFILYDNSYAVYATNVFDSQFGGDKLQVHTDEMTEGVITATVMATASIGPAEVSDGAWQELIELMFTYDASALYGSTPGSLVDEIVDNAAAEVWNALLSSYTVPGSAGKRVLQLEHAAVLREEEEAQGATASTITLHDDASSVNGFYDDTEVVITGGTGIEQTRHIHGYVGSSRIATIHPDWITTPGGTIKYVIRGESQKHVHEISDDAITAAAIATNAIGTDELADAVEPAVAIVTYKLDRLIYTADDDAPADNSIIAMLASKTGNWSMFSEDTSSLRALRDLIITRSLATADYYLFGSDEVITDSASRTASKADVSGLSTHDAAAVKTALEADGSKVDHLWEMTEDDAGVRRLTTNALEQAPSGGASAVSIRQEMDSNSTQLAAIVEDTGTTLPGLINAISGGDGSVVVEDDYRAYDLTYKYEGVGIDNATIYVYLRSDYDAGNTSSAYVVATTSTDVTGGFTAQLNLDPAWYTFYYFKQGEYGPDTQEVEVTE